ncbi:ABC transporter permease subunit [Acetivibrio ethanolgignens]|uniref:Uncharacterized protein n=1 Tax=Acetivibrio ethanolgignens TaxID=290052 RepID=A0A0V8QKE4_9FIRM|nr:ABC transporter permease subunit [Acetivibrio ethanolgignens]KSV60601.1 hypothetical protein ASU35_00030 [Acetivibrio ethanolgignens]
MFILKNQIKSYYKNIFFYIGIIIVALITYFNCAKYINLHYVENENELEKIYQVDSEGIVAGRIPTTYSEKLESIYKDLREMGYSQEDVEEMRSHIEENSLDFREIYEYFEKDKGMTNISVEFEWKYSEKKGTMKEVNELLSEYLSQGIFSEKISNKFTDFMNLYLAMITILISVFLFRNELRKDTYELLHTKSFKASNYILSKVFGQVAAIILACIVVLIGLTICSMRTANNLHVDYNILCLFWRFVMFCIPTIIYISSFSCLSSLIFKTPVPAIPILFLQVLYSNTGSRASDGSFIYVVRPLSLLTRFPGDLFKTVVKKEMYYNGILLLLVSFIILIAAIQLWKRRTTL